MLTPAQKKALAKLASSRQEWIGTRGLAYSGWKRMMTRLCSQGLASPYVHGGYEITERGRQYLHQLIVRAEELATGALGNSNEAQERGHREASERYHRAAQRWLDEANLLRGQC